VVIALGDFYQLSLLKAKSLWQDQTSPAEKRGQLLWSMFKDVVVLTERMRQLLNYEVHLELESQF
jgi:hypothetical protein